jgi:cell division protein FtsB
LKEEIQKAAEKEATISSLTAENEALKKQVEDLKTQLAKKKK